MGTVDCLPLSDDDDPDSTTPSSEHTVGPSFDSFPAFLSCDFAPKFRRFFVGPLGCHVLVGQPLAVPGPVSGPYLIGQCCGEALLVLSLGTASEESRIRTKKIIKFIDGVQTVSLGAISQYEICRGNTHTTVPAHIYN